jgi:COMPASS component SPP1
LGERKRIIKERITGFEQQRKLLIMVSQRAEQATKELKDKSICGYDSRLAMNEAEFALWLASEEGKTAFTTGVLGPRTEETKIRATRVPQVGFTFPEPPKVSEKLENICTRVGKKCKHKDWLQYHNNDYMNCRKILMDEYKKLTAQEDEIIDDAETREATKSYYAHNTVTQLF